MAILGLANITDIMGLSNIRQRLALQTVAASDSAIRQVGVHKVKLIFFFLQQVHFLHDFFRSRFESTHRCELAFTLVLLHIFNPLFTYDEPKACYSGDGISIKLLLHKER